MFSFTVFYMHKCTKTPQFTQTNKKVYFNRIILSAKFKKAIEHELLGIILNLYLILLYLTQSWNKVTPGTRIYRQKNKLQTMLFGRSLHVGYVWRKSGLFRG